jgi:hypothetical protein
MKSLLSDSESHDKLFFYLHQIVIMLGDLDAGTLKLYDILHNGKTRQFIEFVDFLNSLEVFGSGY